MSLLRTLGLAAAVISGSAKIARDEIDRRIQKKIDAKIIEAEKRALTSLEDTISQFVGEQLITFTRNLAFKAIFIGAIFLGYFASLYDQKSTIWIVAIALSAFMIRDAWALYPTLKQVLQMARSHNWNLFKAIRELVAADVFDKAYEEVMEQTQDPKVKHWIALSRYSKQGISKQIADAISTVAANASIPLIRTHASVAIAKAATLMVAYSLSLGTAMYLL
jgi:hypothetical protein